MCEYPAGGGPQCSNFTNGVTKEMKEVLVKLHNDLRQKIAMGKGEDCQPQAANMMVMTWSDEAQRVAQRWAEQCTKMNEKDVCRKSCDNEPGGQNVAMIGKQEGMDVYLMQKQIVMRWFQSGKGFKGEFLKSYKPDPNTDPYVQVVWAQSDRFGCGFSHGILGGGEVFRLVCNYYPGPENGAQVYLQGPPCSKCAGKCSSEFRALCMSTSTHVWNRDSNNAPAVTYVSLVDRCMAALSVLALFCIT